SAARMVPTARAGPIEAASSRVLYDTIVSRLDFAHAKRRGAQLPPALRLPAGAHAYVSGQAAIQHDLDPVFSSDLHHGEFAIALPAALVVLLSGLGLSAIVRLPLALAA